MKKFSYLFYLIIFLLFLNLRPLTQQEINFLRNKIAQTASSFVGKNKIVVNNKNFNFDCSSLVLAVMLINNIKIFEKQAVYIKGDNGVQIIYKTLKKYNRIFKNFNYAKVGDLIFFNNTYDKNKNGIWDDLLTHIAIITEIKTDGTIKYVHTTNNSIEYGYLNLKYPQIHTDSSGRIINSFLRRNQRNEKNFSKFLSSNLFFCFGSIFSLQ